MICSFSGLRNKEIVNIRTGMKIGYVDDVEIDTVNGSVVSLIVFGKPRAFGLMGRDDSIVIKCSDIQLIGDDTILVNFDFSSKCTKSKEYKVENLLRQS
jgi:YlmC/YmxH family sporulation protein